MQLHQLLRFIDPKLPIIILDINKIIICKARSKQDIPVNLYEEEVFEMSAGISDQNGTVSLGIMLRK